MKFLIIEDDPEIIETVSLILKIRWPDSTIISELKGERGVELVETASPNLVILDLGLPDTSGFDVLKQIRDFSSVPIIILTVRAEEDSIIRGLESGADDYILKPFVHMELLARIQAVLRRLQGNVEHNSVTCGDLRFGPSFSKLYFRGKAISLTNTEGLILYYLMKNAGIVLSYTRLAELVWGSDYPGSVNSIRVYIRRLRNKLETDPNNPEIIITKAGIGYYLQKPG